MASRITQQATPGTPGYGGSERRLAAMTSPHTRRWKTEGMGAGRSIRRSDSRLHLCGVPRRKPTVPTAQHSPSGAVEASTTGEGRRLQVDRYVGAACVPRR